MKKSILFFFLAHLVFSTMQAQTTNYGTSSGTLGTYGSYFGYFAGASVASSAWSNSFFGHQSGSSTSTGATNTAIGSLTLYRNTIGYGNTAIGSTALQSNLEGYYNTASGYASLINNTAGNYNTASGYRSLYRNTTGHTNTAMGKESLFSNTGGTNNVAIGGSALLFNTTGGSNVAVGNSALLENTTGVLNTAVGLRALDGNVTGNFNSALGYNAGPSSTNPGLNNTTAIGYLAMPTAAGQVRIGNTSVTSIGGQVSWSTLSDGRFKRDIKEDVSGLEFIKKLRPVSYAVDAEAVNKFLRIPDSLQSTLEKVRLAPKRQTGFVAQEVEAIVKKTGYVFHGVEAPQNENDHYSIRYAEFVVPLVKAVQELTTQLEEEQKQNEEQQMQIQLLLSQLDSKKEKSANGMGNLGSMGAVLFQNNPNPFTLNTQINFSLPESVGQATLIVYNMEGKQLKVMSIAARGNAKVEIQAQELKAGMYIYSLIADGKVIDSKRMILTGN